jgi:hypothetical protein
MRDQDRSAVAMRMVHWHGVGLDLWIFKLPTITIRTIFNNALRYYCATIR